MSLLFSPNEDGRVSAAADATLDEYATAERNRILNEARRLSNGSRLTAGDIVNAYEALRARSEGTRFAFEDSRLEREYRWRRTSTFMALVSVIFGALVAALFTVIASLIYTNKPLGDSTGVSPWWFFGGAAAALFAGAITVGFLVARDRRRRDREEELRVVIERAYGERFEDATEAVFANIGIHEAGPDLFLRHWQKLDDKVRRLAQVALGMPDDVIEDYPIGPLLDRLMSLGVIDAGDATNIRYLLFFRNELVHDRVIRKSDVGDAVEMLRALDTRLEQRIREHEVR